jgi:hypothetical protein
MVLGALTVPLSAQQPQLGNQYAFPSSQNHAVLSLTLVGRPLDSYVLLADLAPGQTTLLGRTFDLAFTPAVFALDAGVLGNGSLFRPIQFAPSAIPPGLPIYLQFGEWIAAQGFGTLLVSNVSSFVVHATPAATGAVLQFPAASMTGVFDRSVTGRLQALPPTLRTVHPLPPQAYPFPQQAAFDVLHPSGSRFQLAFRAVDLGASGVPETLTAVRWRPLFGVVTPQTHPQFELLAAHTAVVPDYTIDPYAGLPIAPNSGLSQQFANNPAGAATSLFNGSYAVQPASLLPSGYLPFPALQQAFVYDGERTLLLETRCAPAPGGGQPLNHEVSYLIVPSSPNPYATVYASAGWNGQPSPLQPTAATTGTGGSFLYDWELEFLRTTSLATSQWQVASGPSPDYQTPIIAGYTPPGTTMQIEFRGALDMVGTGATAWSTSQDVADGFNYWQFRVHMTANATTGAVPWLESLVVPVR